MTSRFWKSRLSKWVRRNKFSIGYVEKRSIKMANLTTKANTDEY